MLRQLIESRFPGGLRVLTEMVAPYSDSRPTQARKNAFDVGEYGTGMCANRLRLGCDGLGHIAYL
jgi:primary-amine oxidase